MTITRTSPARHVRTAVVLLAASAIAVSGAGCSSKNDPAPDAAKSAAAVPAVSVPPLPAQPSFASSPVGAIVDVKIVDCPTDAGEQTAKLTLKNSTKEARDYAIMVIWLKNGSGTPLGSALVKVQDAAPGKEQTVSAKAKVVAKADKCTLNVKAGSLK